MFELKNLQVNWFIDEVNKPSNLEYVPGVKNLKEQRTKGLREEVGVQRDAPHHVGQTDSRTDGQSDL